MSARSTASSPADRSKSASVAAVVTSVGCLPLKAMYCAINIR